MLKIVLSELDWVERMGGCVVEDVAPGQGGPERKDVVFTDLVGALENGGWLGEGVLGR